MHRYALGACLAIVGLVASASAQITPLQLGVAQDGTIEMTGQSDFYRLEISEPAGVLLTVSNHDGGARFSVYVKKGGLPSPNDHLAASEADANEQVLDLAALTAGTYYVQVLLTQDCWHRCGGYRILARPREGLPVPGLAEPRRDTIGMAGQSHYYRLDLTATTRMAVIVRNGNGGARFEVYVKKDSMPTPDDNLAGSAVDGVQQVLDLPDLSAGTYYIQVLLRSDCWHRCGEYSIEARPLRQLPALDFGTALDANIGLTGQSHYYRLDVSSTIELMLFLRNHDGGARFGLYIRKDGLPTAEERLGVSEVDGVEQLVDLPGLTAGSYYVQVLLRTDCWHRCGGYQLLADVLGFGLAQIRPSRVGNAGFATLTIIGAGLEDGATVGLNRAGQAEIVAEETALVSPARLLARFDLRGVEPGLYDVLITNPGGYAATAEGGLEVIEGGEARLWVDIVGRNRIRRGQESSFVVRYGNAGTIDADYPWLAIGVPALVEHNVDVPWALPHPSEPAPAQPSELAVTLVDLSSLPVGGSDYIVLRVTPDASGLLSLAARVTVDPDPYFEPVYALARRVSAELAAGATVKPRRQETQPGEWNWNWDRDVDMGPSPPAGYVMVWKAPPGTGWQFHLAKSIGDGQFIEMTNDKFGSWLRASSVDATDGRLSRNSLNSYMGALRPPNDSPAHRAAIQKRARELLDKYGGSEKSKYDDEIGCREGPPLRTNCHGAFLIMNTEFIEKGLTRAEIIVDVLHPEGGWDSWSAGKAKYPGRSTPSAPGGTSKSRAQTANTDGCSSAADDLAKGMSKPVNVVQSIDPNDKAGPAGSGERRYVMDEEVFQYVIYFENLAKATAEAERVVITDNLDSDLDWDSLELANSSHGDVLTTSFDREAGLVTWSFTGINLPPNKNPPEGEGWVGFTVSPKPGLSSNTEIRNKASIVFDFNEAIETPEWVNTIDAGGPTSEVQTLTETQSTAEFEVSWSGQDDDDGSGIRDYTIYVADDDGEYDVWLANTADTSGAFTGEDGHSYKFYSRATDNVGHVEPAHDGPDTATRVEVAADAHAADDAVDDDLSGQDLPPIPATCGACGSGAPLATILSCVGLGLEKRRRRRR